MNFAVRIPQYATFQRIELLNSDIHRRQSAVVIDVEDLRQFSDVVFLTNESQSRRVSLISKHRPS